MNQNAALCNIIWEDKNLSGKNKRSKKKFEKEFEKES